MVSLGTCIIRPWGGVTFWDEIMNLIKLGLCTTASFWLAGCSLLPFNDQSAEKGVGEEIAVLTDYQLKDGFITIKAVGYGCTFFNSFKVEVADRSENALEVIRTRPDNCRMKPRNVSLQYSFKHLGLDLTKQVEVTNPIKVPKVGSN